MHLLRVLGLQSGLRVLDAGTQDTSQDPPEIANVEPEDLSLVEL